MGIGKRLAISLWRNTRRSTMSQHSSQDKPVENSMQQKLLAALKVMPTHLEIINESYMHNVPKESETHFRVFVVSEMFNNQALIKRHQLVHKVLEEELKGSVHALSIQAKTPEQYEECVKSGNSGIVKSPPCLGGFGR